MFDFSSFIIPIAGLSEGEYEYNYTLRDSFFLNFEKSPVKSGEFEIHVIMLKKSDHLEFSIDIQGVEHTNCDRCLTKIELPIEGKQNMIVKYDDEEREEEEVVFIGYNTTDLDLSKYIYEFVCLLVPMVKLYDCEDDPDANCDYDILDKMGFAEENEDDKSEGSLAQSLKNIKL